MTDPYHTEDLARRDTIAEIVRTYETQTQRIRDAYQELEQAGDLLTAAFGKVTLYSSFSTLPHGCHSPEYAVQEVLKEIKKTCWRNLIERLGIRRVIGLKRAKELDEKLEDIDKLPEITVQNIYETLDLLHGNAAYFMKETVKEVYEAFHINPERRGTLKTNLRNAVFDLGRKIICVGSLETSWGRSSYHVSHWHNDKIRLLDKVFHVLDGKPFNDAGYICPLIDAIQSSGAEGKGETDYFKFKCYENQNLHLEFKRLDLLKEFNRIANDGTQLKSGQVF